MMRVWKRGSILFVGVFIAVFIIAGLSATVSAEEFDKIYHDPSGDVFDVATAGTTDECPYIDILSIETDDNGVDTITAKMVLAAPPNASANYGILLGDTTSGSLGSTIVIFETITDSDGNHLGDVISRDIDDNTITWVFDRDVASGLENYDIVGSATFQWFPEDGDYIMAQDDAGYDSSSDNNEDNSGNDGEDTSGNGENTGGGTPGFEAIAVIVALAIALIILRRKK